MYYDANKIDFVIALSFARDVSENIRTSVTHPTELSDNAYWYLHADERSGFGLVPNKDGFGYDLVAVWSLVPGRGDELLNFAQGLGARTLDCYDGFLVDYYTVRGWVEYARESNWNGTGPDVVFLTRN